MSVGGKSPNRPLDTPPDKLQVYSFNKEKEGLIALPATIREPSHYLFEQLSAIHQSAFGALGENGWSATVLQDLYHSDGVTFYTIIDHDTPTAFAVIRTVVDESELLTLAVSPEMQGRGAAQNIMATLVADMQRCRGMAMFLEVRCDNHAALRVYQKLGFKKIGLRRNYYKTRTGDHIDAYTFKKHF